MSVIDGVGIDSTIQAAKDRAAAQDKLGQNTFLEMLVAQLENQDPMNPQDSSQFAAQLAQFTTVEQLIGMRTGIDKLVSAFSDKEKDPTANLDPASLVGREVVVYGNQIEVDSERSAISMPIRTRETATKADVRILDADGNVRYQGSILPVINDREVALRAGDHTFEFDPAAHGLPEGTYRIEFTAKGTDDAAVTVLPMVTGVVTGAVLAGDPAIRIGNRLFALDDILEVRMAQGSGS